ncbi:MAG: hypothetical protein ABIZ49_06330 [Opitutaceae bacterium]
MRFLVFVFLLAATAQASVPPQLEAALKSFRADAPRGWSFTQTTTAAGQSTVERCDATKPEFERWSLVRKNGRPPTADEAQCYAGMRSRRSRGGTAPSVIDQLDLMTIETVTETPERATYRTRLKPGEKGDNTAAFLRATIVLYKPSSTIESLELASAGEFSPTFGVRIAEMKTRMTYSPPTGDTPVLPQGVTTRVRGRAFWFKSLDAEMTVTFSDYEKARKR